MKIFVLLLLASVLLFGCTGETRQQQANATAGITATEQVFTPAGDGMPEAIAKNGDKVLVDYLGKLEDGTVFDTSIESEAKKAGLPLRPSYEPFEFTLGSKQVVAGFDKGVLGMKVGETKTLTIPPEEGYGEVRNEMILQVPVNQLEQNDIPAEVGAVIQSQSGAVGIIIEVKDGNATVDFNHQLAGKTLTFQVTLVEIK